MAETRASLIATFSRSQVAAGVATAVDYVVLFGLVELFHVWYVIATAGGAFAGAVANFLLNRYWSFQASEGPWEEQAWRYTVVSGASLFLNAAGVYAVTELFSIHYAFSVLGVSVFIGVFFNYPLHHRYVYRPNSAT